MYVVYSMFLMFKCIQTVRIDFFLLKVANIRCFILIAVEIFHNIIRNSLERRKYVAVWFSCIQYNFNVDTLDVHTTWRWTHSVKLLRMCEFVKLFVDWRTRAQIKSWKHKNVDGFYTKTTQKRGFSKLCVKLKIDFIPTYSMFQHVYGKHNLVSFYGQMYFDSRIAS
jgi:hypothetical protein